MMNWACGLTRSCILFKRLAVVGSSHFVMHFRAFAPCLLLRIVLCINGHLSLCNSAAVATERPDMKGHRAFFVGCIKPKIRGEPVKWWVLCCILPLLHEKHCHRSLSVLAQLLRNCLHAFGRTLTRKHFQGIKTTPWGIAIEVGICKRVRFVAIIPWPMVGPEQWSQCKFTFLTARIELGYC